MEFALPHGRLPNRRPRRFAVVAAMAALAAVLSVPSASLRAESPDESTTDSDSPDREDDSPAETTDRDVEPPDGSEASPSAETLLEEASEIVAKVARVRGLDPTARIEKGVKTREELRDILVEKLAEEQSKQEMRQEAAVFRKLGLIPEDFAYREVILDVLTEQIAGFYDQQSGALNIMVGIPLDLQRPAMAHEIFHAIQDQHFNLTRMLEPFSSREHGDFQLARSALVEGDATVLMIDFSLYENDTLPRDDIRSIVDIPMMADMLERLDYDQLGALESLDGQGQNQKKDKPSPDRSEQSPDGPQTSVNSATDLFDSALSDAPAIIRRTLIFPYLAGMRFVIALRSGRTWKEFNEVYDRPPVSTEQILHPQRYADRDEPVVLSYAVDGAVPNGETIYDTVLGEFQMRLFLEHHLEGNQETGSEIDVPDAARGWDGDRLLALRQNDDQPPLLAHVSVWDSRRDAREYFEALTAVAERRFPDASTRTASGKYGESVCYRSAGEDRPERIYVEQWGDAVLHLEGAPTSLDTDGAETDLTTYQLREQIWESLDRTPFRDVYRRRMQEKKERQESD